MTDIKPLQNIVNDSPLNNLKIDNVNLEVPNVDAVVGDSGDYYTIMGTQFSKITIYIFIAVVVAILLYVAYCLYKKWFSTEQTNENENSDVNGSNQQQNEISKTNKQQ